MVSLEERELRNEIQVLRARIADLERELGELNDLKNSQRELREGELRFRNLADAAPVMIWVSGVDKLCTFFNTAWLDFTGRTMEQELGAGWASGVHPEDLDRCFTTYSSSFDARSTFQMEYRLQRADGEYRWILDRGIPLYREAEFCGYIGSCIDVTEHRLIEEALRMSQQRLELSQEVAGIGTWDWDIASGQTHCSSGYRHLYGLPPGDLAPPPEQWLELVYSEDRAMVRERLTQAVERTDHYEAEFRVVWPDDTVHWLYGRGQVFRDSRGNPTRAIGVNMDISERKRAEEALRRSELVHKQVLDIIPSCIFVLDVTSDGRFKFVAVNPAEEKALGVSSVEVSGKCVDQVLAEGAARQVTEHYRSCLEAGTDISYEDELDLPGGRYYFRTTLIPVRNAAGHIHRIVGCCIDLTEVKRNQEEAVARQKLESLGVLAAGIAHDFNNILSSILAEAEFIESDLPAKSFLSGELQRIKTVAIRGAEIVRQLMIYAGHEQVSSVEPIDLSEIAKEILELLKVSISKQVILKMDLPKGLPPVWGNAPQIRQVLMNLIINASEAIGDKQGVITVSTTHVTEGKELAPNNAPELRPGDYVRMEVSDTGRGMTEEAKSKMFDPFYSTKFAGRGLGLSAVQGIVRNHGGGIQIMTAPGHGTVFQVFLHCAPKRASEIPGPITSSEPEQSKVGARVILVVEDEETLRRAVSRALRNRGFSVLEANDGSAAIDLIREHNDEIEAVFLDVTLPGVSSRVVFEAVLGTRPDVKVIVTSAYAKETVDASFAGLRIEYFIRKPFHLSDVAQLVAAALSVKSNAARTP